MLKVCLLVVAVGFANKIVAGENFKEVYSKGISEIRKQKYAQSEALFKQAGKLAGSKVQRAMAVLQLSLAMKGRKQQALDMLQEFKKTEKSLPSSQNAQIELRIGNLAFQLKKYDLAADSLQFALDSGKLSDRDKSLAYRLTFDTNLQLKRMEEAREVLEDWENKKNLSANDYGQILLKRGFIAFVEKDMDKAIKLSKEAGHVKGISAPYVAMAYQQVAYIYQTGLNDSHKAKKYVEKSASVKGGSWGYNQSLHKRILKKCGEK